MEAMPWVALCRLGVQFGQQRGVARLGELGFGFPGDARAQSAAALVEVCLSGDYVRTS
jgi:hypothetical protein